MTPQAKAFLDRLEEVEKAKDARLMADIVAEDVVFHSSVVIDPIHGREEFLRLFTGALNVADTYSYRKKWVDGLDLILEFEGMVGDKPFAGFDRITLNADGHVVRFEIALRPIHALVDLAAGARNIADRTAPEAANQ